MKKRTFKKLVNEMIREGLTPYIKKETERLFNSGGVDPELYGDDYTLPKVCLHVALKNA